MWKKTWVFVSVNFSFAQKHRMKMKSLNKLKHEYLYHTVVNQAIFAWRVTKASCVLLQQGKQFSDRELSTEFLEF